MGRADTGMPKQRHDRNSVVQGKGDQSAHILLTPECGEKRTAGLLYLDAYSRARNGKMTEEQLALYTDQRNWEVSFSGKEAVRLHESDYTVSHEGKKYKLDMHIKYGNRATNLIRIYFCRDVDTGRIIVGSMPEHLATASQST